MTVVAEPLEPMLQRDVDLLQGQAFVGAAQNRELRENGDRLARTLARRGVGESVETERLARPQAKVPAYLIVRRLIDSVIARA